MAEVPLPPGYVLVEKLGAGGFAQVWLAEQGRLGRRVAVKVLGETLEDSERERRFLAECRAIGRLSGHPSVVTVHDAGTTDAGHPYLVMEHLPGGSLHDRVARQGSLPWVDVLRIGVQVADALAAAHDAGILHRDVKPANVLLDENGSPKLGDFGIARLSEGTNTATGALVGTIPFTPPEVLSGHRPGPTADVWALGATLHALLSGSSPFGGHRDEPPAATIARVLRSEPPPLGPEVPAALRDLIFAMLAVDPDDRPQTAGAVVMALQVIQADRGLEITPARVTRTAAPSEPLGLSDATAVGLPALDTPRPTAHPPTPPPPAGASTPPPPPPVDRHGERTTGPETWEPPGGAGTPPPPPPILAKDGAAGPATAPETWEAPVPATPPPPPPIDPATAVLPGAAAGSAAPDPAALDGGTAVLPTADGGGAVLPPSGAPGLAGAPPGDGSGGPAGAPPPPPRRDDSARRSKAPLLVGLAALVVVVLLAGAAFVLLGGDDDGGDASGDSTEGPSGTDGSDDGGAVPAGVIGPEQVVTNLGTPMPVPAGPSGDPTTASASGRACGDGQCGAVSFGDDVILLEPGDGVTTLRRASAGDLADEDWSVDIDAGEELGGLTKVGDVVVVSSNRDGRTTRRYQVFDPETGEASQLVDLAYDDQPVLPNPQPVDGVLLISLVKPGRFVTLDLASGETHTVEGRIIASDADTVWAAVGDAVVAYDVASGSQSGGPVPGVVSTAIPAPQVPYQRSGVLVGDRLYVGTPEAVVVVDPATMEVVGQPIALEAEGTPLGAPIAISSVGDLVVVMTASGDMGIEGPSGEKRWAVTRSQPLIPTVTAGAVWVATGDRLVAGLPDSGLQAISLRDGSLAGSLVLPGVESASAVVPFQEGIAVLDKATITGYGLDDLKPEWTTSTGAEPLGFTTVQGGVAVIGSDGIQTLTA